MKIAIVTDTWDNVNGVVTTLKATATELLSRGHTVLVINPSQFRTVSAIGYPEIKLSWNLWHIKTILNRYKPDSIHIATEGPLGIAARLYCKFRSLPYTTSYHTKFPEYLQMHYKIPTLISYAFMKWCHNTSHKVLVTTTTMKHELEHKGFTNLVVWSRGVNSSIFNSTTRKTNVAKKPVLVCVSRASVEKGLDDFCSISTSGTKILVGDGPYLPELKEKYKDVIFVGYKKGESLSHYYANADVFVFPSKTDTFGVVMLEAISCGTPVAAYPVTGPIDIIEPNINGYLHEDLLVAIEKCITICRNTTLDSSKKYTWSAATDIFETNLVVINR